MIPKKILFPEDPETARFDSQSGLWVSRHGRKYIREHLARYAGATHVRCKSCLKIIPKDRILDYGNNGNCFECTECEKVALDSQACT